MRTENKHTLKCQLIHRCIAWSINNEHSVKQQQDYRVKYAGKYSSSMY